MELNLGLSGLGDVGFLHLHHRPPADKVGQGTRK
jgi:hypothetical protein